MESKGISVNLLSCMFRDNIIAFTDHWETTCATTFCHVIFSRVPNTFIRISALFALADGGNLIPFVINAVWTECKTLKAYVRVVSRSFFASWKIN